MSCLHEECVGVPRVTNIMHGCSNDCRKGLRRGEVWHRVEQTRHHVQHVCSVGVGVVVVFRVRPVNVLNSVQEPSACVLCTRCSKWKKGTGVSFSSTCVRTRARVCDCVSEHMRARVRVTEGWVCLSVCLCASVHVCVCLCLAGWPAVHVSEGWVCARARACVSSGGSPCSWMQQKQTHQINGQLLHQTPVTNVLEARHCERQRR